MILNGKYYESIKIDSPEYKALEKKWSDEAWIEETTAQAEEYAEHQANYHQEATNERKS